MAEQNQQNNGDFPVPAFGGGGFGFGFVHNGQNNNDGFVDNGQNNNNDFVGFVPHIFDGFGAVFGQIRHNNRATEEESEIDDDDYDDGDEDYIAPENTLAVSRYETPPDISDEDYYSDSDTDVEDIYDPDVNTYTELQPLFDGHIRDRLCDPVRSLTIERWNKLESLIGPFKEKLFEELIAVDKSVNGIEKCKTSSTIRIAMDLYTQSTSKSITTSTTVPETNSSNNNNNDSPRDRSREYISTVSTGTDLDNTLITLSETMLDRSSTTPHQWYISKLHHHFAKDCVHKEENSYNDYRPTYEYYNLLSILYFIDPYTFITMFFPLIPLLKQHDLNLLQTHIVYVLLYKASLSLTMKYTTTEANTLHIIDWSKWLPHLSPEQITTLSTVIYNNGMRMTESLYHAFQPNEYYTIAKHLPPFRHFTQLVPLIKAEIIEPIDPYADDDDDDDDKEEADAKDKTTETSTKTIAGAPLHPKDFKIRDYEDYEDQMSFPAEFQSQTQFLIDVFTNRPYYRPIILEEMVTDVINTSYQHMIIDERKNYELDTIPTDVKYVSRTILYQEHPTQYQIAPFEAFIIHNQHLYDRYLRFYATEIDTFLFRTPIQAFCSYGYKSFCTTNQAKIEIHTEKQLLEHLPLKLDVHYDPTTTTNNNNNNDTSTTSWIQHLITFHKLLILISNTPSFFTYGGSHFNRLSDSSRLNQQTHDHNYRSWFPSRYIGFIINYLLAYSGNENLTITKPFLPTEVTESLQHDSIPIYQDALIFFESSVDAPPPAIVGFGGGFAGAQVAFGGFGFGAPQEQEPIQVIQPPPTGNDETKTKDIQLLSDIQFTYYLLCQPSVFQSHPINAIATAMGQTVDEIKQFYIDLLMQFNNVYTDVATLTNYNTRIVQKWYRRTIPNKYADRETAVKDPKSSANFIPMNLEFATTLRILSLSLEDTTNDNNDTDSEM